MGQTLVTGSDDKTVRFWDVHTGQERMTLTGHTGAVSATQFGPDGHTLATGGRDGTVRLWHAAVDEMATASRDESVRPMPRVPAPAMKRVTASATRVVMLKRPTPTAVPWGERNTLTAAAPGSGGLRAGVGAESFRAGLPARSRW